jgi:hypothetical protein
MESLWSAQGCGVHLLAKRQALLDGRGTTSLRRIREETSSNLERIHYLYRLWFRKYSTKDKDTDTASVTLP